MTKEEFQALLDKYLNGLATAEETKLLDRFFDIYHKKPGNGVVVSAEVREEILQNIQGRIKTILKKDVERRTTFTPWLRAAAAILFFVISGYFLFNQFGSQPEIKQPVAAKIEEVFAAKGQKIDIQLSDGTRIKLNANTKISYPENFADSVREVTVDGEAYFDVARDPKRPFIVHTSHANTQVVGTSFNIHTTQEAFAVTLVEGKVNVSLPNGQTASLSPNEQATVSRGSNNIAMQKVSVEKYIGWKDNALLFDHITVREAFGLMENWYNVDIKVKDPALMNCIVISKYQNESLENVLNSFVFMLKMDFKVNGRLVTVSGKGCR